MKLSRFYRLSTVMVCLTFSGGILVPISNVYAAGATAASVQSTVNSDAFRKSLVNGVYQKLLGRDATATEAAPLIAQLKTGGATGWQKVVTTVAGSAAYFEKTGSTNEGFVSGLFQDFVERAPDEAEEAKPSVDYLNGGGTREEMAAAVSDSDDFRAVWTQRFYQQFLGRAATETEVTAGSTKLSTGGAAALVTTILSSAEFYTKGGNTQTGWQNAATAALANTTATGDPTEAGGGGATEEPVVEAETPAPATPVNNTRASMVQALLASPEFSAKIVGNYYQKYLKRAATPAEQKQWSSAMQGGASSDQVLMGILTTDEYFNRAGGTTTGFLNQLSQDLLGKAGGASGKKTGISSADDILDLLRNLKNK